MRAIFFMLVGCWFLTGTTILAAAPTAEFLEQLRQRQEFELVLEHIAKLEKDANTPAEVRATLNSERGITLLQQSQREQNDLKKRQLRQEAAEALQKYLDQKPGAMKELQTQVQLGTVYIEHARHLMKNAADSPEELRSDLFAKSREQYAAALKVYAEIEHTSTAQLRAPEVLADEMQKDEFRKMLLQGLLLIAATREEQAESYAKGSDEERANLEKAALEYAAISRTYRTRLAGLYAQMFQGRCLQKLGKHRDALAEFNELLAIPSDPAPFRTLRFKVLVLGADSWLATKEYNELIIKVQPLLEDLRTNEEKSEDTATLRARLMTAKAKLAE